MQDSFGGTITSTYDAIRRLTKREFDDGSDPLRIDLGYTVRDELQTLTRYSDLGGSSKVGSTTYGYDDIGRTTRIKHLDAIDAVFTDYQYSFDAASRMQTEKINSDATTTFTHDGEDQLTGATGGRLETYSYDDNGNRTMSGYSIGTANRITNDGVYIYSYDKEGNITKRSKGATDDTWFYGYDHLNHMIWAELRAEDDDQSTLLMRADYEYDALGRRIEKAVDADGDGGGGTTTTRFSYLSDPYTDVPILWADLNGSSSLTTRYLRGDAVDQIFARIGSGTPAWLLQDHIGSIRNVVNNSGTILATVVNDSYGNQTSAEDADTGDYRLAAMRWDAEKQSFSTLGRDFGPDFGGGYQEDPHPEEFPDGPNNRPYVNNNPLTMTDPSGLELRVGTKTLKIDDKSDIYKNATKAAFGKEVVDSMINSSRRFEFGTERKLWENIKFREEVVARMTELAGIIAFIPDEPVKVKRKSRLKPHLEKEYLIPDVTFPAEIGWKFLYDPTHEEIKLLPVFLFEYSRANKKMLSPADAIREFASPAPLVKFGPLSIERRTTLDCASQVMLAYQLALLDVLGDEDYNKRYTGRAIRIGYLRGKQPVDGPYVPVPVPRLSAEVPKKLQFSDKTDLVPGDWVDFPNHPDYSRKHPGGAWPSESTVYVGVVEGKQLFLGGGLGKKPVTAGYIRDKLVENFNRDGTGLDASLNKKQIKLADLPSYVRVGYPKL